MARHVVIDDLLTQAIECGEVSQVIEIAAGLSPRGWRFAQRYGKKLTYIETDLPAMARRKRTLLAKMGAKPGQHRVAELNALADVGPTSLQALVAQLDTSKGLAIITEGLLNYFDHSAVTGMWQRFADNLAPFKHGIYLSDLHLASESLGLIGASFQSLLSAFVRKRVHFHFFQADQASEALQAAGFANTLLHRPIELLDHPSKAQAAGGKIVRVIAART